MCVCSPADLRDLQKEFNTQRKKKLTWIWEDLRKYIANVDSFSTSCLGRIMLFILSQKFFYETGIMKYLSKEVSTWEIIHWRREFGQHKVIAMKKNLRFAWWKGPNMKQSVNILNLTVRIKTTFIAKISSGIRCEIYFERMVLWSSSCTSPDLDINIHKLNRLRNGIRSRRDWNWDWMGD